MEIFKKNFFEKNNIQRDQNGHLRFIADWSEEVALKLAQEENISMENEHWEIVLFLREFYFLYNTVPSTRLLIQAMKKKYGSEKGNSFYFFKLFSKGLATQASKIAGLPKPTVCL